MYGGNGHRNIAMCRGNGHVALITILPWLEVWEVHVYLEGHTFIFPGKIGSIVRWMKVCSLSVYRKNNREAILRVIGFIYKTGFIFWNAVSTGWFRLYFR